jgi:hypothetical protein
MRTYVCETCGTVVEALGSQAWHRCQGRLRELRPVDPEPAAPVTQGSLFT